MVFTNYIRQMEGLQVAVMLRGGAVLEGKARVFPSLDGPFGVIEQKDGSFICPTCQKDVSLVWQCRGNKWIDAAQYEDRIFLGHDVDAEWAEILKYEEA